MPVAELAETVLSGREANAHLKEAKIGEKEAGAGIMGPLASLVSALGMGVWVAPMLGGLLTRTSHMKMLSSRLPGVAGGLRRVGEAPGKLLKAEMSEAHHAVGEVFGHESAAAKLAHQAADYVGKAAGKMRSSPFLSGISNSAVGGYAKKILPRDMLQRLAANEVGNVAFAGTMTAGSAINAYLAAKGSIRILQKMQRDLTGVMPSAWTVRFGASQLHPLVQEARRETKSASARLAHALEGAGVIGTAALNLFSRSPGGAILKSIALSMGTSQAAKMLTSGDTAINAYGELEASFSRTGQASAETYAGVVGGLLKKLSYEQVQRIAGKWAAEKVPPAELMHRIDVLSRSPAALQELTAPIMKKPVAHENKPAPAPVPAVAATNAGDDLKTGWQAAELQRRAAANTQAGLRSVS